MGVGDRPEHPEIRRLVAVIQERLAAGEPAGSAWPALNETVAAQLIPDWQATLDALQELDSVGDSQPVGYGLSQGGEMGIRLVAAEPRITAAVLGLTGSDWLIDALGSAEKTLHANPGRHQEVPSFEIDSSIRFFTRHLVCRSRQARRSRSA